MGIMVVLAVMGMGMGMDVDGDDDHEIIHPFGEKSSARICLTWPTKSHIQCPVRKSHNRPLPTKSPVTTNEQSGCKAMP